MARDSSPYTGEPAPRREPLSRRKTFHSISEREVQNMPKNNVRDMTVGSPMPILLSFMMPLLLGLLFQQFYSMVDTVVVGNFLGNEALAGVGSTNSINFLVLGLCNGVCAGFAIPVAQKFGEKDFDGLRTFVGNMIWLGGGIAILVTLVTTLACGGILTAMNTPADTFSYAYDYIFLIFLGIPATMLYNLLSGILRSLGDSRTPLFFLIFSSLLNVGLDLLCVVTLKMGVAGAAVATIIGQFCGCALAIYFNHKKNTDITLSLRGFRPNWRLIGEIYAIGLPSVIMIAIGSVMTFLMNKILITYHAAHETAATAFGVYFKLNSFIFMPIFGLNNGVIPIVAYNYGAQNRRRMMATIKRSALYACCIMVFGTVLFWAIPDTLLRLFDASDVMLAAGVPALRIISLSFCMAGACIALGSSFQALGKSMYSMVTSIVRQLVFLIPIAYVLARYGASVGNSDLVWWCYPLAEIFSLTLTLVFFSRMYKTIIAPLPEGHE